MEIRQDKFIGYLSKNIPENAYSVNVNTNSQLKKKLKVVSTINKFKGIGGTEIWLQQMVLELNKRGIKCLIYTTYNGNKITKLTENGIFVTNEISVVTQFDPDLIHLQHATNKDILNLINHLSIKVPIFNLIHGVAPILEIPYQGNNRKIEYGAVSRITSEKVAFLTSININRVHLLRNFFYQHEINHTNINSLSKCAVVSSKVNFHQRNLLAKLFKELSIDISFYGYKQDKMIKNYADLIHKYDFFLCSGKTTIDILGYGKPVILLEENLLGPAVVSENVEFLSSMNFALASPLVGAVELESKEILAALSFQIKRIAVNDFNETNDYLLKVNSIKVSADHLVHIYSKLLY
jgi:hypothetical protein